MGYLGLVYILKFVGYLGLVHLLKLNLFLKARLILLKLGFSTSA